MQASPQVPFLDVRAANQSIRGNLDRAYSRVMDSGRWILDSELRAFESKFARFCGTQHCVGVGNGLDALVLALKASGIQDGDDVLVPAHTFVATWLAIARTGARPVPVEPSPNSFIPTAADFEACITSRTRAVIVVHLYGELGDVEAIAEMCRQKGLILIEDAAQAHGATLGNRRAGSFGVAGCFSFYPGKNLGAFGDGGAVTTSDGEIAASLRKLRNYGGETRYSHEVDGYNSRLDELQAAFLSVSLEALDHRNCRRREIATRYISRLGGLTAVMLPMASDAHCWHLFVIRTEFREQLQAWPARAGVETLIHYPRAVYRLAPFATYGPAARSFSDELAATVLSLPMGPHLTNQQVEIVCDAVVDFFTKGRK